MYCYDVGCIDFYHGMIRYVDYIYGMKNANFEDDDYDLSYPGEYVREEQDNILFDVFAALASSGSFWEIDIRCSDCFFVGGLPHPDYGSCELFYILKQNNNGSTFLISPFSLEISSYEPLKPCAKALTSKERIKIDALIKEVNGWIKTD